MYVIGATPVRTLRPPIIGKEFRDMRSGVMYMNAVARHQGYALYTKSHKKKKDGQFESTFNAV